MYVGKVEPVEIPKSGGKTRRNTSGYIWWITESKWDNDLGYTKDNRITIGKEVPGRPGWIYPNNNREFCKKRYSPLSNSSLLS